MVVVVNPTGPVAEVRLEPPLCRSENFFVTSQMPLANSHRLVTKVVHILWHQFEVHRQAIWCRPVYDMALQA